MSTSSETASHCEQCSKSLKESTDCVACPVCDATLWDSHVCRTIGWQAHAAECNVIYAEDPEDVSVLMPVGLCDEEGEPIHTKYLIKSFVSEKPAVVVSSEELFNIGDSLYSDNGAPAKMDTAVTKLNLGIGRGRPDNDEVRMPWNVNIGLVQLGESKSRFLKGSLSDAWRFSRVLQNPSKLDSATIDQKRFISLDLPADDHLLYIHNSNATLDVRSPDVQGEVARRMQQRASIRSNTDVVWVNYEKFRLKSTVFPAKRGIINISFTVGNNRNGVNLYYQGFDKYNNSLRRNLKRKGVTLVNKELRARRYEDSEFPNLFVVRANNKKRGIQVLMVLEFMGNVNFRIRDMEMAVYNQSVDGWTSVAAEVAPSVGVDAPIPSPAFECDISDRSQVAGLLLALKLKQNALEKVDADYGRYQSPPKNVYAHVKSEINQLNQWTTLIQRNGPKGSGHARASAAAGLKYLTRTRGLEHQESVFQDAKQALIKSPGQTPAFVEEELRAADLVRSSIGSVGAHQAIAYGLSRALLACPSTTKATHSALTKTINACLEVARR